MKKEIKSLDQLLTLLTEGPNRNRLFFTFEESDGLDIQPGISVSYTVNLEKDFLQHIQSLITFESEEDLFQILKYNVDKTMDLKQGADDQYYDYSPSQVRSILYALHQLTEKHANYIANKLHQHLENFIHDEEQDEDQIEFYKNHLIILENALEKESFITLTNIYSESLINLVNRITPNK